MALSGGEKKTIYSQPYLLQYLAHSSEPITKESLAQLLIHFLQYVEAKLGKNSADPPATRIPVSIDSACGWWGGQGAPCCVCTRKY